MALTMSLLESSMDQLFKELAHWLIRRPSISLSDHVQGSISNKVPVGK